MFRKIRTTYAYACVGWRLGDNFRSRWALATLLPKLKLAVGAKDREAICKMRMRVGPLRRTLHMRAQGIFLIYEVLWGNPYIHSEMLQEPPRCILDLGAHIGLATLRFKAAFSQAIIHFPLSPSQGCGVL